MDILTATSENGPLRPEPDPTRRFGLAWLRLGESLSCVRDRLGSKLGSARISFDLGSLLVACLEA